MTTSRGRLISRMSATRWSLEQGGGGDEAAVAMRDNIAPVRFFRSVAWRGDDLEIARAGVDAKVEAVAVVHHVVEEAGPSGRDQPRLRHRRAEIDDMRLRTVMPMHDDERRPAEPRRLEADEPGRVPLHEHFDVVALRRSQPMQHDAEGTMAFVLLDIEERLGVGRPDDVVGRIDDAVGEILPALEVAHGDRQDLRAEVVGAPGKFRMVR